MTDKPALRRELRLRRRAVSATARQQAAERALGHLLRQPVLRKHGSRSRRIGLFWPMDDEFDSRPLMVAMRSLGHAVYLPEVPRVGRRLWFNKVDARSRWTDNRFGIPESRHRDRRRAESLDLLLVPLLGFDARGYRLGMGGGFYDSTLAFRRWRRSPPPRVVGVAYACQEIPHVPHDPWDMPLDAVLTEHGYRRFGHGGRRVIVEGTTLEGDT